MKPLRAATCASILLLLCACQRPAPADGAGARAESGDELKALTHVAFPAWKGEGAVVLQVPSFDDPKSPATIAATPAMVVTIDATHRALVMVGTPSDEQGHESAAHAQGGNLGVYGFERRDGHWLRTTAQDSVLWGGSSGALGEVKLVDLGRGHPALSIEGGWTGQGYDIAGLDLVALEPAGARVVLHDLRLHSDSLGVVEGCDEWLNKGQAPSAKVLAELTPANCFDVTGAWRVQPAAGAGLGDIVVTFAGHRLVVDPRTQAKSVQAVAGTLTYRDAGAGYEKASGENLAPEV